MSEYELDNDLLQQLRSYGFVPGEPVYRIYPSFTLDDVRNSQYNTIYDDPEVLSVKLSASVTFGLVIETASVTTRKGWIHSQKWNVEGWLLNQHDPSAKVRRARMYLECFARRDPSRGFFQVIPEYPAPDPNETITLLELDYNTP